MAKARANWIDRVQYLALRLVSMLLHGFSVDANLSLARHLGDLAYRLDRRHRERALGNLRRSFPELSERRREELARSSMRELFMLIIEVLFTTRLIRIDTWRRYIEPHNLQPAVQLLLKRNQGIIFITGHYGNFEILGYVLAILGFPTASVARPLDNPYVSRWLFGVREKHGQRVIVKKGATEEVSEVLANHGVVGFVADQNAGSKGIFVDFFGRKASTYKSIGLLAMEYNVPVVVVYARRLGHRFRFRMGVQEIIYPEDWRDHEDPLRYITQRYTHAIEQFVREEPGQYWWIHRRWKSRPRGELPEAFD